MKIKFISCLTISLFFVNSISAQTIKPCGTSEATKWAKENIKGYKEKVEANELLMQQNYQNYLSRLSAQRTTSTTGTYTLPVVFHILHTNGAENITDAQCIAALAQVNKDYARLGSDTNTIDPNFKSLYVNSQITFQLAKKDPYGNCTNGIIHHYDTDTDWEQSNFFGYKYSREMAGSWRPSQYLNVYIVKQIIGSSVGTIVGYTYKPGSAPGSNCDAIVYRYDFLAGLQARSLSHEIGHWLGLGHTFGDTNDPTSGTCGNDDISDTPPTTGFFSTCPATAVLSETCSPGTKPNIENIMDYSSCPKMFTQGQTNKMRSVLASSSASRDSLVGVANLIKVGLLNNTVTACAPIADFYANKVNVCSGQSVIYNSTSYNGTISSYSWSFEGGTPATSTVSNPTILYSTPGFHSTTLTVSGPLGSSTKVRTDFISNSWNSDPMTYPVSQPFETGLSGGWNVQNLDYGSHTWQETNVGSQSTSKSFYLPNASNSGFNPNDIDILETPQFNFKNTTNITVSFDYAYANKSPNTASLTPIFKFQYSTDCGGTWIDLPGFNAFSMGTASGGSVLISTPFIPWSSKWVTKSLTPTFLTALNNKPDVKFRFWFKNDPTFGQTQNFYIDQFNISATVGLNELENDIDLFMFPNPTELSSTIEFTPIYNSKVLINVLDISGRLVESSELIAISGVKNSFVINSKQQLAPGVYFITLNFNNQIITKKLIIQ